MTPDVNEDPDSQDLAETFDETNITRDGEDIAHPDMARDVYDVTQAQGDADDEDEARDFDPDEADEADLDIMLERDDGIDEPNFPKRDDRELVADDDASPADYESETFSDEDIAGQGHGVKEVPSSTHDPHVEDQLDQGLKETFPASDPVSIGSGAD